jgi:hypothetical protein
VIALRVVVVLGDKRVLDEQPDLRDPGDCAEALATGC